MGKGLAKALLLTSIQAFSGAAPIQKVSTPGYLQYLLNNNKPDIISTAKDDASGYIRDVEIRFRNRGTPGQSVTTDDCSIQVRPAYLSYTVPATNYRALGITFEDDLIATFEKDALSPTPLGMTNVMKDVFEAIIEQANGIFADIDIDCMAAQAANFGMNVSTGLNTAKTVNFALLNTTNNLASGMVDVMADAMANEVRLAGATIVGSGLINNYYLQQPAKSADQSGVNTNQLALPKFYYDHYAQAALGANKFALLEKDAVQFVNLCRFRGAKAGEKSGDFFMTMRLPIMDSLGQASMAGYEFDVQLTYRTCPGEVQIGAASEGNPPVMLGRGWNIIISSQYQTVFIPSNSYAATDRMYGVNGSFLYNATNA